MSAFSCQSANGLLIIILFPSEIGLVVLDSLLATRCQTRHVFYLEWKHNKPAFYPAKQSYCMTIYASIFKPACTKPTASATYLNVVPYQFVSLNVNNCHSERHAEGLKINKGLTNPEKQASASIALPSHINNQQRCYGWERTTFLRRKNTTCNDRTAMWETPGRPSVLDMADGHSPRHISAQ